MAWTSSITTPTAGLPVPIAWFQGVTGNLNYIAETSWVPQLNASTTNPTLGAGSSSVGSYVRVGERYIYMRASVTFGTSGTSNGSGVYRLTVPVNIDSAWVGVSLAGSCNCNDSGTNYYRTVVAAAATYLEFYTEAGTSVGATTPFTWGASDILRVSALYKAAS